MGRKIPGRKHRGVRDPEKQREQRLLSIKDKINAPPIDPDDQEVPKSLEEFIKLKEKAKKMSMKKPKDKSEVKKFKHIMELPNGTIYNFNNPKIFLDPNSKEKPAPIFMQRKGESDKHFVYRMTTVCEEIIKETEFENKYNVDVQRSKDTGEVIEVTKKPKNEIEEYTKMLNKDKKRKSKVQGPKLTKSQKKRLKKLEKKEKKMNNSDFIERNLKDEVKFGEVVHGPPSLTAPRKVEKSTYTPRPGKKDLILKSLLPSNSNPKINYKGQENKILKSRKTINNVIDKKGKRKDLPVALRRQLDVQQKEVINAYKELKKRKANK